ncbi:MAG: hypothetical protein J5546_00030 [Lachnospiraceae bacterium]|nr:hypothetical protein [Lachnospiraceae bacterium]
MGLIRIMLTCIAITVFPAFVGTLYVSGKVRGRKVLFSWIFGLLTLFAGFEVLCVPMILLEKNYVQVRTAYLIFCGALLALSAILFFVSGKAKKTDEEVPQGDISKPEEALWEKRFSLFLWILFACLIAVQVFCVFYLSYEDGDDSFYVAITTFCNGEKPLYRIIPYTGYPTSLDARHALAPFPVWVATLAELSGLSGAATAHVFMPLLIIPLTYVLYYLLGSRLLASKGQEASFRMPLFLCMVALLVLFGGYSIYSPENFLLVRATQGKAVIANVVIPALLYLLMILLEKLERGEKTSFRLWLAVFMTMTAGCLCSTLGGILLCMLFSITLFCAFLCYGRIKTLILLLPTMAAPLFMAALYAILP